MIKLGITGSLASGKTTVARMFSRGKYPLFNADIVVKKIYKKKFFKKKFIINLSLKIKKTSKTN